MNGSATRPAPATPVSGAVAPQPPRLLDQVRAALASRQTPLAVINHYVSWIEAYIRFHQLRHPRELGAAEVSRFLSYLAMVRQLPLPCVAQAQQALVFLYEQVLELTLGPIHVARAGRKARVPAAAAPFGPAPAATAAKPPAGGAAPGERRLLDQMCDVLRLLHYARRTEKCYVDWARRFILFHGKRHPREMGVHEVEAFLTHLAVQGNVSASTQNQALCALLFLYEKVLHLELGWIQAVRAKRPERLPVVMARDEVRQVLEAIQGADGLFALMCQLQYGSGLRVLESCQVRVHEWQKRCQDPLAQ